jgi:hypothetical protein
VLSPAAAKSETLSDESDVQKATKMKPMDALPKPVLSATATALLTVKSLALSRIITEARRMRTLPTNPTSSNSLASPQINATGYL